MPRTGKRFMDAAKVDTLNAGWTTANYSSDAILRGELARVRARSRHLAVNDPYFKRFLHLCEENVIGHNGIVIQMRVIDNIAKDGTVTMDKAANRIIENAWWEWNKRKNCTHDRRDSFLNIQRMVLKAAARDGEVFIRKIRDRSNPFFFSLQMLEADHVDITFNREEKGGGYIRLGIEYDSNDRIVAYHVFDRHPGDRFAGVKQTSKRIRLPASDMIHVFIRERPTQSRGIPWGVSSMARSKMLDGYEQAELVAARVGASKMGFFKNPDGQSYGGDGEGVDVNGNTIAITDADPGTFEQLPEGWDFQAFDPQHPSTAYEPFVKQILRGITTGFGVGYNKLSNNYEGVTYSSLRESNLTERDYWRLLQTWFAESLHEEIYLDWLTMAITTTKVPLPITKLEKFDAATWRGRGWPWVDPLKEQTANKLAYDMGTESLTNICAQQGRDFEEILQERKSEFTLMEQYGIVLKESGSTTILVDSGNDGDKPNAAGD